MGILIVDAPNSSTPNYLLRRSHLRRTNARRPRRSPPESFVGSCRPPYHGAYAPCGRQHIRQPGTGR